MTKYKLFLCLLAVVTVTSCVGLSHNKKAEIAFEETHGVLEDTLVLGVPINRRVEKVYFQAYKHDLTGPGKRVVLRLVEYMKKDDSISLVIIGHTDTTSSEDYSIALGEKRANAVKQFILECDSSLASRVTVQSKGKAEPEVLVYSTDAKEVERANAQNRRAVIMVKYPRNNYAESEVSKRITAVVGASPERGVGKSN